MPYSSDLQIRQQEGHNDAEWDTRREWLRKQKENLLSHVILDASSKKWDSMLTPKNGRLERRLERKLERKLEETLEGKLEGDDMMMLYSLIRRSIEIKDNKRIAMVQCLSGRRMSTAILNKKMLLWCEWQLLMLILDFDDDLQTKEGEEEDDDKFKSWQAILMRVDCLIRD